MSQIMAGKLSAGAAYLARAIETRALVADAETTLALRELAILIVEAADREMDREAPTERDWPAGVISLLRLRREVSRSVPVFAVGDRT